MKKLNVRTSSLEAPLKRPIFSALWLGALVCSVSLACGSDPPVDGGTDTDSGSGGAGNGTDSGTGGAGSGTDSGTGGGSSSSGGSGSSTGGSGSTVDDPDDACGSSHDVSGGSLGGSGNGDLPEFEDCTGSSFESEASEADIFFLVDRSVSMGDHNVVESDPNSPTRWEALTTALKEFINDPSSETLRVGLGFFPKFGDEQCDVDAYATPDVPIDFLSDNAGPLTDAIEENTSETNDGALFPTYGGLTPSVPAFTGALTYAKQWAEDHPERPVVVVFATDGYPTDPTSDVDDACDDTSISTLEDLAEEYLNGDPRISTFVVGIGEVSNLKRVADAGGTNDAFFVNDCPTAIEDLTESLKRVANSPALCGFEVPEPPAGQTIDPDEVNVVFTPKNGTPEIIYKVPTGGNCGSSGGWYFDNANEPEQIFVCPQSCSMFGGGTIEIVVGCESQILG
jgi:hypothetical protein